MKNKIKVIWLCHVSDERIRKELSLGNRKLENIIRKYLYKKSAFSYGDKSPWVSELINKSENRDDIEIHIVSPSIGLKKKLQSFEINRIQYHFFKPSRDFLICNFIENYSKKNSYKYNRIQIKKIFKQINPDIICLFGAESPWFSTAILDIVSKPVFVLLQTIYHNPERIGIAEKHFEERVHYEKLILKHANYFGCPANKYYDFAKAINNKAVFFKFVFPIKEINVEYKQVKKFDFVFFGRVKEHKGIEDLLLALVKVKNNFPNVTLNVYGDILSSYKKKLKELILQLKLTNNVRVHEFIPTLEGLLNMVTCHHVAVLPVKLDTIPSTVRECARLKIPVVTYETDGMYFMNKYGKAVLTSEIGNIDELANNMIRILCEPNLRDELIVNAKRMYDKEFSSSTIANEFIDSIHHIYNNYYHGMDVPKEVQFDKSVFEI